MITQGASEQRRVTAIVIISQIRGAVSAVVGLAVAGRLKVAEGTVWRAFFAPGRS